MADQYLVAIYDAIAMSQPCRDYLTARGILSGNILARPGKDEDDYKVKIIDKYIAGHTIGGQAHQNTEDEVVIIATLLAAWHQARSLYCVPVMPATAQTATATPAATQASSATKKVPNALPTGVWTDQVTKYNAANPCKFPEAILLGADRVMA